jgi:hypothetical protein
MLGDVNFLRPLDAPRSADAPSRRQKAFLAIEGREADLLERNPWNPIHTFAPGEFPASGGVLSFTLSDPLVGFDTERLALLWDDEVPAAAVTTVEEGQRVVVDIPAERVLGRQLSIWLTDGGVSISALRVDPLSRRDEVHRAANAANKAETDKPSPFSDAMDKFVSAQTKVGIAVVVVAGIVLYAWSRE